MITQVLFLGGMGFNQFRKPNAKGLSLIQQAESLPNVIVDVVDDAFKREVNLLTLLKGDRNIIIQHSRSWYIASDVCQVGLVDLLIACDPAWVDWGVHQWPTRLTDKQTQKGIFYKADSWADSLTGICQLNIIGGPEQRVFDGIRYPKAGHNDFLHTDIFRREVLMEIING